MTTAREIADKLNEYEATHPDVEDGVWNDVIYSLPEYDDMATDEADPNGECNVVVLIDGTRIDKREGEWVAVSTPTARERGARRAEAWEKARLATGVRDAQWGVGRAEARLHQRIREAADAGVSERKIAEASGISRAKVRRILGRD